MTRGPARRVLLAVGGLSLVAQVLLLRELTVAFYGVELAYLVGLAAWMAWTSAGAALPRRGTPSPSGLAGLLAAFALALPLSLAAVRLSRRLLLGTPGAWLPFEKGALVLVLAVAPVGLVLGLLFQRAARLAIADGGSFARAYALESAGAVLGGASVTLALAVRWAPVGIALAAATLALVAAVSCASGRRRAGLAVAAAGALALSASGRALDLALTRADQPAVVETVDSPYARLAVLRRGAQAVVLVDGAVAFESESVEAEALVHPALVQHPRPRDVLVLGGCASGLLDEVLRHHPAAVTCVELDDTAWTLARRHFPRERVAALDAPEVTLVRGDPRRFLETARSFDVILVGTGDPDSGLTNRYHSREFFLLASRRLAEGGLLVSRLRGGDAFWPPLVARRMASVTGAIGAALPAVLVLPGETSTIVAARTPLLQNADVLGDRLAARGAEGRLVRRAYLAYVYDPERVADVARRLADARAPANTDARPLCYRDAAVLWLSRFFPHLAFGAGPDAPTIPLALLGLFAATPLVARAVLPRPGRRAVLALLAGFAAMAAESVLVLHYQATRGALFQDLGILLAAFMAGMALGPWAVERVAGAWTPARRGRLLVAALAAVLALVALEVRTAAAGGLAGTAVLLLGTGALVGGVLAHASLGTTGDPASVVSPLYAADLAGGCLGGLAASLVLVPGIGLEWTALGAAALIVAALAVV